ncbi:nucleotidyl transferase AbiEii/AbiGii toxin family protein [Nesterenkonia rhizosphaerae]|uniref:Nucleotidyl transferase AbiEii/AbiGii toxin family protein n=1 Tax=Nesterenkonia rhizosphaerae TaxID=1348272 RepID=A0ABP9G8S8_9MICC
MSEYKSWKATQAAMKEVARARASQTGEDVNRLLKMAHFDRLLARVFTDGDESWMLKGGSSMLARVADARSTKDLDLISTGSDLDDAETELRRLVESDLGDHVRMRLLSSKDMSQGENQPQTRARRLMFEMQDIHTGRQIDKIPVDLAVEHPPIGAPEMVEPSHRLATAREIPAAQYRLFPLSDQVADKVCATMQEYGEGKRSSRAKDLVDLVVIAKTQSLDLQELQRAIEVERLLRRMPPIKSLEVPRQWAAPYRKLAKRTPACHGLEDLQEAEAFVRRLIDPALEPHPNPSTWIPNNGWDADSNPKAGRRSGPVGPRGPQPRKGPGAKNPGQFASRAHGESSISLEPPVREE